MSESRTHTAFLLSRCSPTRALEFLREVAPIHTQDDLIHLLGTIEGPDARRRVVGWAADCAERVLPLFENKFPNDDRPRKAIEAARSMDRAAADAARAAADAAYAAADAARAAAEREWQHQRLIFWITCDLSEG